MQDLSEIYQEGRVSYKEGKSLEDNPYSKYIDWHMHHIAWQMGYCYQYQKSYAESCKLPEET